MTHFLIGLTIGAVMGFTGAGGALVAIPLLMHFLEMTLKEASVLSLFAVVIASLSNFLAQRHYTKYKTGLMLVSASFIGSLISAPFKKLVPDFYVALLLTLISLYALFNVWKVTKLTETLKPKNVSFAFTLVVGLALGLLTTITGLGGGVLMVPVLLSVYGFTQNEAIATSLFAVGLSSLFSFLIQIYTGTKIIWAIELSAIVIGVVLSAFLLTFLTKKIKSKQLSLIRKVVFTAVVILAIVKIF